MAAWLAGEAGKPMFQPVKPSQYCSMRQQTAVLLSDNLGNWFIHSKNKRQRKSPVTKSLNCLGFCWVWLFGFFKRDFFFLLP